MLPFPSGLLEKNKNIPDEIKMVIELNNGEEINYKVHAIRLGEYDIIELCERNLYVLLPLYVIKLRREFENIDRSTSRTNEEKMKLNKEKFDDLLRIIAEILELMKGLLENEKITLEDYDIMATAMTNLVDHLYNRYDRYEEIDKEVKRMVKTFLDPATIETIKKAKNEGKMEEKIEIAKSLLDILDDSTIADKTGLAIDEVRQLRSQWA